ncbi:MAG: pyrimidine dimer DNA glycosylase/endonuclease V [bacterium]|nr:pyrimidine dimer DNA glycosylase/endonuclease V [bacterium]
MRIWDLPPEKLCRNHLLGEHSELHALWTILTQGRKGFSNHPETRRWRGKLKALYARHEKLVEEMQTRGYWHRSPLSVERATGDSEQTEFLDLPDEQVRILRSRGCECRV